MDAIVNLTVDKLASVKSLDADALRRDFGLRDTTYGGLSAVRWPVYDARGGHRYDKARLEDGTARRIPDGGPYDLYGLWRLPMPITRRIVMVVEGETNVWAAAEHGVVALATGGASNWRGEFAPVFAGRRVVLWEEPGEPAFAMTVRIAKDLPTVWLITGDSVTKDLCQLHQQSEGLAAFRLALRRRLDHAVPITKRAEAIERATAKRQPPTAAPRAAPAVVRDFHEDDFAHMLERARQRPIEEVFGLLNITLKGRGAERTALCPFHEDTKPSLSVNVQKRVWRCHACDARGDAIRLIELAERATFVDAVRRVAR
jgi:hypothetical protein